MRISLVAILTLCLSAPALADRLAQQPEKWQRFNAQALWSQLRGEEDQQRMATA